MGFFDKFEKGLNIANSVYSNVGNTLRTMNEVNDAVNWSKSEEKQKELDEAQRYRDKAVFLERVFIVIWLVIIVTTIVLCVKGDDIILRLMHL